MKADAWTRLILGIGKYQQMIEASAGKCRSEEAGRRQSIERSDRGDRDAGGGRGGDRATSARGAAISPGGRDARSGSEDRDPKRMRPSGTGLQDSPRTRRPQRARYEKILSVISVTSVVNLGPSRELTLNSPIRQLGCSAEGRGDPIAEVCHKLWSTYELMKFGTSDWRDGP